MKKLLTLLIAVLAIAGFIYYSFSAPRVLERRLNSLLGSLSFGVVSLKDLDKEGDKFASLFAEEVTFSGAGNEIISGTVNSEELKTLYLDQFRVAVKSSRAKRVGEFKVSLQSPKEANMQTSIQLDTVLRDNSSYPQTMPITLSWKKENGDWVITKVKMETPLEQDFNF